VRPHEFRAPRRLGTLLAAYVLLAALCIGTLIAADEFSLGRRPWENLKKTAVELSAPSFLALWFGSPTVEYRSDDGRVLRVENRRETEERFLLAVGRAVWVTFKIATLGSLLAALVALPFGLVSARNMHAPPWLTRPARIALDVARSIHTLVFGLILVGIIGLGPMAGIIAIALHSFGTYGKLYAESIETIDAELIESGLALGLTRMQTLVFGLGRTMLPRFLSIHFYIWEFNVRDSTVLGLIGAGGLGLLVSEAVSLFQWGRLATLLIAIVAMVALFDWASRKIRTRMLGA
jgi:phosphonate ABC transporter permease subunit PhnE